IKKKYHVTTKENAVAIDSFYYSTSPPQLLLFKVMVRETVPVSDEGLTFLLNKLGLLELGSQRKVSLLFVVPPKDTSFQHLTIQLKQKTYEKDSVLNLPGIGKAREALLKRNGVYTIGDLRKRVKDSMAPIANMALEFLTKRLRLYDQSMQQAVVEAVSRFKWERNIPSCYSVGG
ncbi:hypothetical protein JG687_00004169, partial [Phytophthora cactorum]